MSLAARGSRKLTEGPEQKIVDPAELAEVRRQARIVYIKGLLVALVLTLAAFLLPMIP